MQVVKMGGALDRIRTCDMHLGMVPLYPTELRARTIGSVASTADPNRSAHTLTHLALATAAWRRRTHDIRSVSVGWYYEATRRCQYPFHCLETGCAIARATTLRASVPLSVRR